MSKPVDALVFRLNEIGLMALLSRSAEAQSLAFLLKDAIERYESQAEDESRAEADEYARRDDETPVEPWSLR